MANPTSYTPEYSFSDFQESSPSDPLPAPQVDNELTNISTAIANHKSCIEDIRRSDGELKNAIVGIDALKPEVTVGLNAFSNWQTATLYGVRAGIYKDNKVYYCLVKHTSGTFATDLAAGKWFLIADFQQFIDNLDAALEPLTGLTPAANKLAYYTGADTAALTDFTSFGRSLVGATDGDAAQSVLGLGDLAVLNTVGTSVLEAQAVTYAKMQNASAGQRILGRRIDSAGVYSEQICTEFAFTLLTKSDAGAWRDALAFMSGDFEWFAVGNPLPTSSPSASGTDAFAVGSGADSTGSSAIAMGSASVANGTYAVAINCNGFGTVEVADYSVAIGGLNDLCQPSYATMIGGQLNAIYSTDPSSNNLWCGIFAGRSNIIEDGTGFYRNIIGGAFNTISGGGTNQDIFGGNNNTIDNVDAFFNVIVGGRFLEMTTTGDYNAMLGGSGNEMFGATSYSTIIGGSNHKLYGTGIKNSIFGGASHTMGGSGGQCAMLGGYSNDMFSSGNQAIMIGGFANTISNSNSASHYQMIFGGQGNTISTGATAASHTIIFGGQANTISSTGGANVIIGARASSITGTGFAGSILGGSGHSVTADYACVVGGSTGVASGINSIVLGGLSNTASGPYSVASGRAATASLHGERAHMSDGFSAVADAMHRQFILRGVTSNSTPGEIFLDGSSLRLTIPNDTTWWFDIKLVARRSDADNESAAYRISGCIDNNANTVALVGSVSVTVQAEDNAGWDATASADNTNKALIITVTGENSKTIRWVAVANIVQVTG